MSPAAAQHSRVGPTTPLTLAATPHSVAVTADRTRISRARRTGCLLVIGILLLAAATSSGAPQEGAAEAPASDPPAAAPADERRGTHADLAVERRLHDIFAEVDLLRGVAVTVRNGVVELTGEASGPRALDAAAEIARKLDGVVYVENLLSVARDESTAATEAADEGLHQDLQASLRDESVQARLMSVFSQVDPLREVRADVRAGVIRLTGIIDSQGARDQALELARSQTDVLFVDDRLELSKDLARRVLPDVDRMYAGIRNAIAASPLLAVALLLFAAAIWLARRALNWGLDYRFLSFMDGNALLLNLLRRTMALGIVLLGIFMALRVVGLEYLLTALLGGAGIIGVALGFAFRDIIENYLASIILSLRQPFAPKDLVTINDVLGSVVRLSPSYTLLLTPDGNHVRIPNADVFKGVVTNYTRNPRRRFDLQVAVGAGEDLSQVAALMSDTLSGMSSVLQTPEPFTVIEQLGDSSVVVRAFGWMDQREADFAKVRSEAIRMVKARLDEAGVDMPVPAYQVQLMRRREDEAPHPLDASNTRRRPLAQGDVAVDKTIERQVDAERASDAEPDLLDAEAPAGARPA